MTTLMRSDGSMRTPTTVPSVKRSSTSGADLLIHDAQYTDAEYPAKRTWGHSPMEYAVDLAILAGVRHLALFHHDPSRTDQALAQLVRRMCRRLRDHGSNLDVMAAADGLEIELPGILHAVGAI